MTTTLELPDELVNEIRVRAERLGKAPEEIVSDLLRQGLTMSAPLPHKTRRPRITTDPETGLPLIKCSRRPAEGEDLTPEQLKELLLDEELARYEKACRQ